MMGLKGKLIMETEIKGSADKYYNILKTQIHHLTTVSPNKVSAIELHEGDWDSHGAVKIWTYTIDGKTETVKEKIEHDDANRSVTLTALDGDMLKAYKGYKLTCQATPLGDGGVVKVTVEYEKMNESDPPPMGYFDFAVNLFIEEFDAYLVKA